MLTRTMERQAVAEVLARARRQMKAGQYAAARRTLEPVRTHPQVQPWLRSMEVAYPQMRPANRLRRVLVALLIVSVLALALVATRIASESIWTDADTCAVYGWCR